jgi:hypothetical protein
MKYVSVKKYWYILKRQVTEQKRSQDNKNSRIRK